MAKNKKSIPTRTVTNKTSTQVQQLFAQGLALHQQGRLVQAQAFYKKVLNIQPRHFDALHMSGVIACQLDKYQLGYELISKAIQINPNNAIVYNNHGLVLQELKQFDAAAASYERAIAIQPDYAEAHNNLGNVLNELKKLEAAVASYEHAISIRPDYAQAYYNRGVVLQELKRLEAAVASYDRAIFLKPDLAEAYNNRGVVLQELKLLDAAMASYNRAIAIRPDYAEAYNSRGNALRELNQLDAALESYDKALQLKPDYGLLHGLRLYIRLQICDWNGMEFEYIELENKILRGENATSPFPLLGIKDSLALQKKSTELFIQHNYPVNHTLGLISKHPPKEKIRIGYFSADFGEHPVSYLTAGLYEMHDRARFEITAFSFGYHADGETRKRLVLAFDQFLDVRDKSDREVAQLSRDLQIDIAVDLGGHTKDSRPGIFAHRAAPVQVNYLGFPGTMGAEYIDYIIADSTLIPLESQGYYSEKIVYLPYSYMANDRRRKISDTQFIRQDFDLPETGFVFCCFNNNYKITPAIFEVWMRILKAVDGSVLWLREDSTIASKNLKQEAERCGISAGRLVFAKRMGSLSEHMARHRQADLFIDTLPYNAHTTASDALWAGLPVLTCMGESFTSRVAASLLNAIHLPELITHTLEDYERLAIELATHPTKLVAIKRKLEENRLTTPLFNTESFTKHLEAAYIQIHERYQADLPPDHVYIQP
ncbi:MAG: tetratricopeptide repeat protein [Candidatus Contendobacter sp.]|nr:tetratricopeptide repeat protein [Candidatus Contendobacter sp.]MDG4558129.1 tetratricopeptide repeat protein [Candidatus Contendobacter sp.]